MNERHKNYFLILNRENRKATQIDRFNEIEMCYVIKSNKVADRNAARSIKKHIEKPANYFSCNSGRIESAFNTFERM